MLSRRPARSNFPHAQMGAGGLAVTHFSWCGPRCEEQLPTLISMRSAPGASLAFSVASLDGTATSGVRPTARLILFKNNDGRRETGDVKAIHEPAHAMMASFTNSGLRGRLQLAASSILVSNNDFCSAFFGFGNGAADHYTLPYLASPRIIEKGFLQNSFRCFGTRCMYHLLKKCGLDVSATDALMSSIWLSCGVISVLELN